MLSTPPAFNLSQNQTLQFKSVAKISVGRKSESQSSFPFAIHLSMNHTDSLGAKQLFTPLRFRCQQVFFTAPSGQLVGARETYVSFSNTRQELFLAIRENFFSRRPFGRDQLVGANGFMRLFNSTVKHFSAKNFADFFFADWLFNQHAEKTQKNIGIFLYPFPFSSPLSARQESHIPC